jgi:hypothetical protein
MTPCGVKQLHPAPPLPQSLYRTVPNYSSTSPLPVTSSNSNHEEIKISLNSGTRRLPNAAYRVPARVGSCGIYGGRSGSRAGFLRVLRFPLPLIQPATPLSSGAGAVASVPVD